jgi:GNAT superfamily N-acetyltransferase
MHNHSANILIERLGKNNIPDLNALFFAVYERKVVQDFFQKKYDTHYTGVEHLGFIAYNHNRVPVAFYGVIPCYLCCDGNLLLGAQSADTMTDPAYRNQGLFVALAEMTIDLCRKHELRLLFGFPNQHSLPGFVNKLGWDVKETMECFIIPVKAKRIGKVFRKFSLLKNLYKKLQNKILKQHAIAVSYEPYPLFANEDCGVWRSEKYIFHKQYNRNWFIRLPNAFVWMKTGDGLIIGDMLVEAKDFDAVIETLCLIAREMGLGKVVFHCTKNARLHSLFAGRCIPIPSFPVIVKNISEGLRIPDFSFTYADVDTF